MTKHSINEEFFDELNEFSTYVLGYLYALGSVYRGPDGSRYELIISGNDPTLLMKIKYLIGATHDLRPQGGTFQLRISNKRIIEKLEQYGLTANKTKTLTYPDWLPKRLEKHFIRGYFDGKGSFMLEAGRRIVTNISGGSYDFIEGLRDALVLYGLTRAEIHQYGAECSTNVIRYYVNDTRKLYNTLYNKAHIYSEVLSAKYNRGV